MKTLDDSGIDEDDNSKKEDNKDTEPRYVQLFFDLEHNANS
jgi:hypothetical protein